MNENAAKEFWEWFEEKESWIINCINKHDSTFIWAIDDKLKLVFPYVKKRIRISTWI